jgi:hypothetical protein
MKFLTFTTVALLLGASHAFAGGGAPVPEEPQGGPPSGRPSAVLDDAKCQTVWSMTQRDGDTLSGDQAAPYIVNFKMVDADGDGKITQSEFEDGCKNGLVQEQASKPADTSGGQTPEQPTQQ